MFTEASSTADVDGLWYEREGAASVFVGSEAEYSNESAVDACARLDANIAMFDDATDLDSVYSVLQKSLIHTSVFIILICFHD